MVLKCMSFCATWHSAFTTGDTLMIELENGLKRKEIIYVYHGLEGKKIMYVSYTGLERYTSICN